MTELKLGAATVQRIEECYEPNFDASAFFPDGNPTFVQRHRDWLLPDHYARLKPAGVEPGRHGDVHPSARRSRRLEHPAGERQVGADLQERDRSGQRRLVPWLGVAGRAATERSRKF